MAVSRAALIESLQDNNLDVVGSASSAEKAWLEIKTLHVDAVLLDINLSGVYDGIWLAQKIRSECDLPIIFLTAYGDKKTLERLNSVRPNGYLMKPYNEPTLLATISIALRSFHSSQQVKENDDFTDPHIFVKDKGLRIKVDLNKILYIKSDGNYIDIHIPNQKYTVREKLQSFLESIPQKDIVQVHQRYAVNNNYIEAVSSTKIIVNSVTIPVSKTYREGLISLLSQ